jgi:C4-dicarboxylate-specific signal transduction histidine kinase
MRRRGSVFEADELAASIAHEVNQPLAAIVANAQCCLVSLGKPRPDVDRARRAAERIVSNGYHASNVLRGIRAMLRRESLDMTPIRVNELVAAALCSMSREFRRHRVTLQWRLSAQVGVVVADRTQLQQVLFNLSRNAIDSLAQVPKGSRALQVSTGMEEDGSVLVSLSDSGAGLDQATLGRIFEPFFTTRKEGMGLGLSICRSIVEAHRGRIWASPREPRGATFQFTLPGG